jgi:hypothetical protein
MVIFQYMQGAHTQPYRLRNAQSGCKGLPCANPLETTPRELGSLLANASRPFGGGGKSAPHAAKSANGFSDRLMRLRAIWAFRVNKARKLRSAAKAGLGAVTGNRSLTNFLQSLIHQISLEEKSDE